MSYRFSDSPSGRVRHWERRRSRSSSAPWFVRPLIILLAFVLMIVLAFRAVQYALHGRHGNSRANVAAYESAPPGSRTAANPATGIIPGWQRDVIVALDEAQRHASEGDATETNVAVDRAASIVIVARLRSQPAPPGTPSSLNIDELLVATAMGATTPPPSEAAEPRLPPGAGSSSASSASS